MSDLNHITDDNELIEHMPTVETIKTVAEAMKQLGDPSRLRIFWLLCQVRYRF